MIERLDIKLQFYIVLTSFFLMLVMQKFMKIVL